MSNLKTITVTQFFPCSTTQVWHALTTPDLHAQWWAQGDVQATIGHKFFLDMGAWGAQSCEVLTVEVEKLFAYRFGKDTLHTTITWQLQAQDNGTLLTLEHTDFDLDTAMGKIAYQGMSTGWPNVLTRLKDLLVSQD